MTKTNKQRYSSDKMEMLYQLVGAGIATWLIIYAKPLHIIPLSLGWGILMFRGARK